LLSQSLKRNNLNYSNAGVAVEIALGVTVVTALYDLPAEFSTTPTPVITTLCAATTAV